MSDTRQDSESNFSGNQPRRGTRGTSDYRTSDARVQFEKFDSTSDDRKEEKFVFKYIQRLEFNELQRHLVETESRFDITEIYDRSGYSPLHFAAYKNSHQMAELLCRFVSYL